MSVINQMLKDLDNRQNEHTQTGAISIPATKNKPASHWIIIVIGLLIINGLAWFIWTLYSENQTLKTAAGSSSSIVAKNTMQVDNIQQPTIVDIAEGPAQVVVPSFEEHRKSHAAKTSRSSAKGANAESPNIDEDSVANVGHTVKPESSDVQTANENSTPFTDELANDAKRVVSSANAKAQQPKIAANEQPEESIEAIREQSTTNAKPALTISRRALSPEEFVAAKFQNAEEAVQRNELAKAEKALEEILLVTPTHKAARKQLAALWFGRQSYQPAINLLAQGLNLDSDDIEMRIMQARIYLAQNDTKQALNVLKAKLNVRDKSYQVLLASTAQQAGENTLALNAYRQLTVLEPQSGRWWLGLAIALDRNADYVKAKQAYQMAIAQRGLSTESLSFAQQRMSELGD